MSNNFLMHHGVKGMKWGVRRYQNYDGTRIATGTPNLPKPSGYSVPVSQLAASSPRHKGLHPKRGQSIRNTVIGTVSGHYTRNKKNVNLPKNDAEAEARGWRKLSAKESEMHQFHTEDGVRNTKWVSPSGHREVVFTGKGENQHITTDPRDVGTYNYFDPQKHPIGHTLVDALPYVFLGNQHDDSTTLPGRLYTSGKNLVKDVYEDMSTKLGYEYIDYRLSGSRIRHGELLEDELYHYGVLGMHWGVRRYQNYDGTRIGSKISSYKENKARNKEHYNDLKTNRSTRKELDSGSDEKYNSFIDSQPKMRRSVDKLAKAQIDYFNAENDYDLWKKDYKTWEKNSMQAFDKLTKEQKAFETATKYYNIQEARYLSRYMGEYLDSKYPGQFEKTLRRKTSFGMSPAPSLGNDAYVYSYKPTQEAIKNYKKNK